MMKQILLLIAVLLFTGALHAQSPAYDSVLAKKLGADERGMRMYVLVILKTGPKDKDITDKKVRGDLFKGHMANISKLADEHKLSVAGPFEKNDKAYRGLFLFNVNTIEEAKALVETDPTVKAGIFSYDAFLWYGSAALQETGELHKKISKGTF